MSLQSDTNGMLETPMSQENFIPGTQIPRPQVLAKNMSPAHQQMQQEQQWVQMQTVPVQYQLVQQVQQTQQQPLPPMQLQGQIIYAPLSTSSSAGNALYFDPTTVSGQTAETYALEEVIQATTTVEEDLNDLIATTLSSITGSAQTYTNAASGQLDGPIMDIFMSNTTGPQIVTDAVSQETEHDDTDVNNEDFSAGMRDTSEIPKVKLEGRGVQDLIETDSCAIERQVNAPAEIGKNRPQEQAKENEMKALEEPAKPDLKKISYNITDDMKLEQEPQIIDRLDKAALQKLLIEITQRTAKAVQDFAATGDIRIILATHRRLTDVQDNDGDTPLHLAVINGQDQVLLALIQLIQTIPGCDEILNRMNDTQLTPLHIAVHSENANAVKWLMAAGADALIGDSRGNTALHLACSTGQTDLLEYMLMKCHGSVEPHNYNGLTPLHILASKISESARQCISLLVTHGHSVDAGDMKSGRTALHIAAEENNLIVAGYLISECNADLECRTFGGLTPLHIAVARDSQEIATLLLACGADTQAEFSEDPESTPLSLCVSSKMKNILDGESTFDHYNIGSEYSSVIDSNEDLYSLEPLIKLKLCRLLDPTNDGRDWYALAKKLGRGALIGIFEDDDEKSPTETLLENYSCIQGTVAGLKAALTQMDRQDAIDILNKSHRSEATKLCPTMSSKDELDVDRVDSAFESMNLSENTSISIPQC